MEGRPRTKRLLGILALAALAAAALLVKSWWSSESSRRDATQIREQVKDLGLRQEQLETTLDSMSRQARHAIDSLNDWVAQQVEPEPESTAVAAPVVHEESPEERAERVWKEALGALPQDLNAYERLVAEQELKETLAKRFDLTKEQLKKITAES